MPELYRVDLPNIMHETIDGEVVVVNLDNGTYYSFDGVGGRVWDLLSEGGRSLEGLTAKVSSVYSGERDEIATAVARFVAQLREEELISVAAGDDAAGNVGDGTPQAQFVAPVLNKYTDMEALLLVDPIHEVEDAGWPNVK